MKNNSGILIVDGSMGFTGAFKSIWTSTIELKDKFNFYFAIPVNSANEDRLIQYQSAIIRLRFVELSKSIYALIFYLPTLLVNSIKIIKFINSNEIKIVHINDIYNMIGVIVKVLKPRVIVIYHVRLLPTSYIHNLYPYFQKLISKHANHIICVSNAVAAHFTSTSKMSVIYDAIQQPRHKKKIEDKSAISILYLANYVPGKGQEYAIEAFRQASEQVNGMSIVFAGGFLTKNKNKLFRKRLEDMAKNSGYSNKFEFKDFITNTTKQIIEADILLNFSDSESFSLTTLEALTLGTPCIVTDSGGPTEIVEHEISGLVVPCKDIPKMAHAIIKLSSSLSLRKKFSDNGIKRAEKVFNLKNSTMVLYSIYNGLLSRNKSDI
jgi:L-malate glycosyltransferase